MSNGKRDATPYLTIPNHTSSKTIMVVLPFLVPSAKAASTNGSTEGPDNSICAGHSGGWTSQPSKVVMTGKGCEPCPEAGHPAQARESEFAVMQTAHVLDARGTKCVMHVQGDHRGDARSALLRPSVGPVSRVAPCLGAVPTSSLLGSI